MCVIGLKCEVMLGEHDLLGVKMGPTRRHVSAVLEIYLGLIRSEAASIVGEMTRQELFSVLNARRHAAVEIAGELVPILLRCELRQIDESDEEAVCEAIDRGKRRLEWAERRHRTNAMCSALPSRITRTSSSGKMSDELTCFESSAAGRQIQR